MQGIPLSYMPSVQEVRRYIEKWNELESYVNQEYALDLLFVKLCPSNNCIEQVLLKIVALNDFYSTHIFDVHTVAKHFMECNIDARLQRADETLVDDLSYVTLKNGGQKHFYSFATKFCSHHKPTCYPIFDKYVAEVLKFFRKRDGFNKFKNEDLKEYSQFKSIVADFRKYYNLNEFSFKQIDQYIWQLGKDFYKRQYN